MLSVSQQLELTNYDRLMLARTDDIKTAAMSISGNLTACPKVAAIARMHFAGHDVTQENVRIAVQVVVEDLIPHLASASCDAYLAWSLVDGFAQAWHDNCRTHGYPDKAGIGQDSLTRTAGWRAEMKDFAEECQGNLAFWLREYPHLFRKPEAAQFNTRIETRMNEIALISGNFPEHVVENGGPSASFHTRLVAAYAALTKAYVLYIATVDADVAMTWASRTLALPEAPDKYACSDQFDRYLARIHKIEDMRESAFADITLLGHTLGLAHHNVFLGDMHLNRPQANYLRLRQ